MDDAVQAIMMAFSAIVFVIALSLAVYLINRVTRTSEYLTYYSDSTRFYDNIKYQDNDINEKNIRYVSAETIIPTLYRYSKENFCVKIYDANGDLIQIFDVNLEGKVRTAVGDTKATAESTDSKGKQNYAYKTLYDDKSKDYYMFGVPWLGSTESIKARIDLFINGQAGYINNVFVDYRNNKFYKSLENMRTHTKSPDAFDDIEGDSSSLTDLTDNEKTYHYEEQLISYSYSGETIENDDGDILVTGAASKDKIIIIYKLCKNP